MALLTPRALRRTRTAIDASSPRPGHPPCCFVVVDLSTSRRIACSDATAAAAAAVVEIPGCTKNRNFNKMIGENHPLFCG
ncbi:unnamed protein product [Soboliphyme baturini]|uniref:Secreted protein n=1 Tax=Soboliphyme baturini TaxID=241478 RepID=A0A183IUV0_9BILA|nr:unnamed protein product [Soboliphyme baturini]